LRASKALFQAPLFGAKWVVFSRVVFFSSFVQKKQKSNKHPPTKMFFKNVELFEGVKGPHFKPLYLELYGWFFLVLFFSPPLSSKKKKKQQRPTHVGGFVSCSILSPPLCSTNKNNNKHPQRTF
jgi:hypothetical protein